MGTGILPAGHRQVRKEALCHKKEDVCLGVGCSPFGALPLWEEVYPPNRPSFASMVTQIQGARGAGCRWLKPLSEFDYTVQVNNTQI